MNKIEVKEKVINLEENSNKVVKILLEDDKRIVYNIPQNASLIVYQYGVNISNEVIINLNGDSAKVEFHYSMINYDNNKFNITVNHNFSNTRSDIYNHGLNVFSSSLNFNVTGFVKKTSDSCICNQENQIINLQDGKSIISPNLLIDNYDVSSSHSAYIGKFNEDEIFYLMSRGLSRKKSNDLLIKSFLINSCDLDSEELNKFINYLTKI